MPAVVGIGFVLIVVGAALAILVKDVTFTPGYLARKQSSLATFQDVKSNSLRSLARMVGFMLIAIGVAAIVQPFLR